MRITFRYGTGNECVKDLPEGTTIGQALGNPSVQAFLGYGNNVEGHVGGVPQAANTTLRDAMTVSIHDKACTKAS